MSLSWVIRARAEVPVPTPADGPLAGTMANGFRGGGGVLSLRGVWGCLRCARNDGGLMERAEFEAQHSECTDGLEELRAAVAGRKGER